MVRFCAVLIGLDVFFIGVSSIHRVYTSILEGQPFLGSAWDIRHDYSYAEIFGYLKLALLIVAMLSTARSAVGRSI